VSSKPLLLLTDPAHFEVTYTINPWMQPRAWAQNPVGHVAAARRSFKSLASALIAAGAGLEIMPGVAGLPDMVSPPMRRLYSTAARCSRGSAMPNAGAKSGISRNAFTL
jgi:hypothetical protein